jgi:hypothetical protein
MRCNCTRTAQKTKFCVVERIVCIPDGDDLLFDYDPELIQDCSNRLKFETVNIFLRSKDLDPEQLDKVLSQSTGGR